MGHGHTPRPLPLSAFQNQAEFLNKQQTVDDDKVTVYAEHPAQKH